MMKKSCLELLAPLSLVVIAVLIYAVFGGGASESTRDSQSVSNAAASDGERTNVQGDIFESPEFDTAEAFSPFEGTWTGKSVRSGHRNMYSPEPDESLRERRTLPFIGPGEPATASIEVTLKIEPKYLKFRGHACCDVSLLWIEGDEKIERTELCRLSPPTAPTTREARPSERSRADIVTRGRLPPRWEITERNDYVTISGRLGEMRIHSLEDNTLHLEGRIAPDSSASELYVRLDLTRSSP